jgi:hypothetical protein
MNPAQSSYSQSSCDSKPFLCSRFLSFKVPAVTKCYFLWCKVPKNLRMVKFRKDHHMTHTNREKKPQDANLNTVARMRNMRKKYRRLYCVPNNKFSSEDNEILYRSSQDIYQQRKENIMSLAQITRIKLFFNTQLLYLKKGEGGKHATGSR